MTMPGHDREQTLLQVLRRHLVTQPRDRLLYDELEAAWTHEIGECGTALRATVQRLVHAGVFAWHETVCGETLELTGRGARVLRQLPSESRCERCPRGWLARLRADWLGDADDASDEAGDFDPSPFALRSVRSPR